ncbi:lipoyl(octanoyl) transferase LipB [Acidiferrobacter sp.]|uniref:lipoyl(octanoyl) transferase LipB n=1 Tax=Acidiferrobacter sp. TaxID=1872107 RepID=UPI00262F1AD5|nr:lipoyl(octanoyl) transferase LipB [Acidiferrobacter sp.]
MRTDIAIRRWPGLVDFQESLAAMRAFSETRTDDTPDEIWVLEHAPVYTRGRNAKEAAPAGPIPTVDTDRGGDLTYHGPGQLIIYALIDLARRTMGVRHLVSALESAVVDTLAFLDIQGAETRAGAPGVYVGGAKIASLGLRIRGGRSYHGLALNVAMDLTPFTTIAPCGYRGLRMTQIADCGGPADIDRIAAILTSELTTRLRRHPGGPLHDADIGLTSRQATSP